MALVNRIKVGTAINKEVYEELKSYSKDSDIPMSRLLDKAIKDLLNKRKNKPSTD